MKRIILVAGHAGSGKTIFSRLLASRLGWPMLDKDTLTQPLVGALSALLTGDSDDRQSTGYLEHIRPLEYRVLMDTLWEVSEAAPGVVVTAPFVKELLDGVWVEEFGSECAARQIAPVYVWMHCDENTRKARIVDRNSPRDRWKILNWTEWQSSLPSPPPGSGVIHVDNSADTATLLASAVGDIADLVVR